VVKVFSLSIFIIYSHSGGISQHSSETFCVNWLKTKKIDTLNSALITRIACMHVGKQTELASDACLRQEARAAMTMVELKIVKVFSKNTRVIMLFPSL